MIRMKLGGASKWVGKKGKNTGMDEMCRMWEKKRRLTVHIYCSFRKKKRQNILRQ